MFVSNLMGGTQIDEIAAPNEIVKLTDQVISYVKEVLQSNVVRAITTQPAPQTSLLPDPLRPPRWRSLFHTAQ